MSDDILSIKIEGLSDLRKDLKKFPFYMQTRILRNANRKAARVIVIPRLESANTHGKGKFSRRGKKGRFTDKPFIVHNEKGSKIAVRVGIASAFFHYRFAEFGTKKRSTYYRSRQFNIKRKTAFKRLRKAGSKLDRGVMPKTRPFIERTLDSSIRPMFKYLITDYRKELDKSINRLRHQSKKATKIK